MDRFSTFLNLFWNKFDFMRELFGRLLMEKERIIITAGLPYANGDIHVGHMAGCYLPADIVNRYFKLKGKDSLYICGTDDHGAAIVLSGIENNKSPEEIVEYFHERQEKAFKGFYIDFDIFGSTSKGTYHKELSNEFFLEIYKKKYFEKEFSYQFYDEKEKIFLPDRYVKGDCFFCEAVDQNGDQCNQCGKLLDAKTLKNPRNTLFNNPVIQKKTKHWFLDLSKLEREVSSWVDDAEMRLISKKYVRSLLKQGLVKRSMTRDLNWGLPIPLDDEDVKGKVLYVWFDAPIGYISNTKQYLVERGESKESYRDWWSRGSKVYHFVGEDNTIFHCVIWIAMLSVHSGYTLPKGVIVNKFMNIKKGEEDEKISKSKKNAFWILDYLLEGHDPDFLRYYLTKISPEKSRSSFSGEDFAFSCNADLADTIGNFISRSTAFLHKFLGDRIPDYDFLLIKQLDKEHLENLQNCFDNLEKYMRDFSTKDGIETIIHFGRQCNRYFNDKAPWKSKTNDPEVTKVTLAIALQSVYFLGAVLRPFLPGKSKEILGLFRRGDTFSWKEALDLPKHGELVDRSPVIFPKIEGCKSVLG